MDLLDFEEQALYFDEPLLSEAQQYIDQAGRDYSAENTSSAPENALLRAYFLAPEHPMVLVALYRFYYYRHRLEDALTVAERVISVYARRLNFPLQWQQLSAEHLALQGQQNMSQIRFYLLALKGSAYLQMRLGEYNRASERLQKVICLDEKDRLGASALLAVLTDKITATAEN